MMVGGKTHEATFILVLISANHKTNQGLYKPINNIINEKASRKSITSFMQYKPEGNYTKNEKRVLM